MSCRKAPPEFRFAPSTLRNFVPSGAAHEAAAGHALSEPSDNYPATPISRLLYLDFLLLTHLTLSAVITLSADFAFIVLIAVIAFIVFIADFAFIVLIAVIAFIVFIADFAFIVLIAVIAGTDRQSLNQSPVYADPFAFHSAEPGHLAFRELMYGRSQLSAHFLICQFSCYI